MNFRFMGTALLVASTTMAFAQREDVVKNVDLNPVTILGTGTYHKADNSPVAVKVISAKDLKDTQVTNLTDALTRLTTNITTQTNGQGTFVNFNGMSDSYMLILENGKRMSGDDRWNRISMSNIKRIEILSGAASALYGSEAIAGVINIITDETQNKVEASNFTKFSSKGRLDEDIQVDINSGKLSSATTYNHKEADNWQVNKYQAFDEDGTTVAKLTGRPMSVAYNSENISQKLEWKVNDKFSAYIRGNYYDYLTARPQHATYFTQKATTNKTTGEKTYSYTEKAAYTYDLHHKSYTYGGGARWEPNKDTHIYLDVYSDNYVSKYAYWQTSEEEAYELTRKRTHYTNETLKGIFRVTPKHKLSAGIELVQESLNSESDNIHFESTNSYNVYAQDELVLLKNLEAVIGMRYTYNDNFGSQFTPNAGLFYKLGQFRFRASYTEGYRTPTLSQLYATDQAKTNSRYTINNTALNPENNHFWNANVEYTNNWMSLSLSGYVNEIKNMINYRTLTEDEISGSSALSALREEGWTTIRQRDNIDEATLKGVSANVKFILPAGFTLSGGYSYTDSKARTKTLDAKTQSYTITENPVDKSVRDVTNVNLTWNHAWGDYYLNVNLNGHVQGRRYSSTYGYAPKYQQWDLNTRHTFIMQHFTLEPSVGIENLFNQRDTSYWNSNFSTINPGRTLYVSVALKFRG